MVNCSNCGAEGIEGLPYCPSCGHDLGGPELVEPTVVSTPEDLAGLPTAELAGLGSRFGARLIDGIVLLVAGSILGGLSSVDGDDVSAGALLTLVVFALLYEVAFIAWRGQTPGKIALNIKVVVVDTDDPPGWPKSFVRWLVPQLAFFVPVLGIILTLLVYLSATWDSRKQGWHDKAATTLVVRA